MKRIATITDGAGRVTGLVHGPDTCGVKLLVRGRVWTFDYDDRLGPLWTYPNGMDCKRQNPPKAVWRAFELWLRRRRRAAK